MSKLTKRHYNRKILMFGVMLFSSVALVSTGFATWVISNGAEKNGEGQLNVGTIDDGGLKFTDVVFDEATGSKFMFEPKKGDVTGDIKWDSKKPEEYENISVTFSTTLAPKSFIKSVKLKLDVPKGVRDAAEANYIVLPECATTDGIVILQRGTSGALEKAAGVNDELVFEDVPESNGAAIKITYTISFKWGTELSNDGITNPSEYLDNAVDEETQAPLFDYNQKMQKMISFRRTIYEFGPEITDEEVRTKLPSKAYKFTASLTAEAN